MKLNSRFVTSYHNKPLSNTALTKGSLPSSQRLLNTYTSLLQEVSSSKPHNTNTPLQQQHPSPPSSTQPNIFTPRISSITFYDPHPHLNSLKQSLALNTSKHHPNIKSVLLAPSSSKLYDINYEPINNLIKSLSSTSPKPKALSSTRHSNLIKNINIKRNHQPLKHKSKYKELLLSLNNTTANTSRNNVNHQHILDLSTSPSSRGCSFSKLTSFKRALEPRNGGHYKVNSNNHNTSNSNKDLFYTRTAITEVNMF